MTKNGALHRQTYCCGWALCSLSPRLLGSTLSATACGENITLRKSTTQQQLGRHLYGVPQKCCGFMPWTPWSSFNRSPWLEIIKKTTGLNNIVPASNGHFCRVEWRACHASTTRVYLGFLGSIWSSFGCTKLCRGTLSSRKSTWIQRHSGPGLANGFGLGESGP